MYSRELSRDRETPEMWNTSTEFKRRDGLPKCCCVDAQSSRGCIAFLRNVDRGVEENTHKEFLVFVEGSVLTSCHLGGNVCGLL